MKKRPFLVLLFCALPLLLPNRPSYGMANPEHVSLTRTYVGGMSTEVLKTVHSEVIDHVPWWSHPGGGQTHRDYWGT